VPVAHRDHQHLVVADRPPAARPLRIISRWSSVRFSLEPREGRAEEGLEVDLVEAELPPGEVDVHVVRGLGRDLAEVRERELDLLAGVAVDHLDGVVHDVGVDALEDAALGVGVAHGDLVERLVVLRAVGVLGHRHPEQRLVVRADRGAGEGDAGGVGEPLDRPAPTSRRRRGGGPRRTRTAPCSSGSSEQGVVAALAAGVLVGGDDELGVEVLEEHPVGVGHAEGAGRRAEVPEHLRERAGVGVLVAEVAARDEHHHAVGDAEGAGDEEGRERGDGLAVARDEHAEGFSAPPRQTGAADRRRGSRAAALQRSNADVDVE
jgi:hypothetical protein